MLPEVANSAVDQAILDVLMENAHGILLIGDTCDSDGSLDGAGGVGSARSSDADDCVAGGICLLLLWISYQEQK